MSLPKPIWMTVPDVAKHFSVSNAEAKAFVLQHLHQATARMAQNGGRIDESPFDLDDILRRVDDDGGVFALGGSVGKPEYWIGNLVVRTEALREFERHSNDAPLPTSRAHVSAKLAKMNQAAAKFWGNADRDDRGTHPDNATVTAWLLKQGFSQTLANKAATIIRPEWVPTGRKPEE